VAQRFLYLALFVLAVALASPIERLSAELFWVQHDPARAAARRRCHRCSSWHALGSAVAMPAAECAQMAGPQLSQSDGMASVRFVSRTLGRPVPSFLLFSVVLLAWHVPALFDATLRSTALHAARAHPVFCAAIMFWKQVIPSPPLRARLMAAQRVVYAIGGMTVSWVLAVVLALAPHPSTASTRTRPAVRAVISAIADQQLAAGIMWVPGSITFLIVVFIYVHRWLMEPEPSAARDCTAGRANTRRIDGADHRPAGRSLSHRLDPHLAIP